MDKAKRSGLERAGWRIGSVADFVQLTAEASAYVGLTLTLSELLRAVRTEKGLSQVQLAKLLGSSQSRVAKMEAADQSVSLDLLLRGLLSLGTNPAVLGQAIAATQPRPRDRSLPGTSQARVAKRTTPATARPSLSRPRAA